MVKTMAANNHIDATQVLAQIKLHAGDRMSEPQFAALPPEVMNEGLSSAGELIQATKRASDIAAQRQFPLVDERSR